VCRRATRGESGPSGRLRPNPRALRECPAGLPGLDHNPSPRTMAKRGAALNEGDQRLVAAVRHARISGNVQSRLAFPFIMSTSSHQSTRTDATAYPWGWLGVLGTVIVVMITGAGWLYQKNGEWPVPATQDPRNAAHEQRPAAAAIPSGQNSVAERVRNPSDVASPPSLLTPSTPPMQSEPAVAEPSAAPEPDPPLPETVDTDADRGSYHAGTDAPPHVPPPVGTPPAGTYTIQRGDTLIAIAAHFYGNASQWSVIAQANPEVDPRRLRVGQVIKLPARPSPSESGAVGTLSIP